MAVAVMFAGCKKDKEDNPQQEDNPQPKFNIVELSFGRLSSLRPQTTEVESALAAGADSVYLVSTEDFDILMGTRSIYAARDDAKELTAISPRVRGKGVINPTIEVAADVNPNVPIDLESCGFKYIPGYIKQN